VFVPIDGSLVSRTAAEFALHYAETTGAELTLGLLSERRVQPAEDDESKPDMFPGRKRRRTDLQSMPPPMNPAADPPPRSSAVPDSPEEELIRISAVFRISSVKPTIRRIDYDPGLGAVADAIVNGKFDLVVLGAENRAVRRRLFFGHENELILALEHVTTLILVPHRSRRH
jgi:nucleotide-binding universal stress UspA family protein